MGKQRWERIEDRCNGSYAIQLALRFLTPVGPPRAAEPARDPADSDRPDKPQYAGPGDLRNCREPRRACLCRGPPYMASPYRRGLFPVHPRLAASWISARRSTQCCRSRKTRPLLDERTSVLNAASRLRSVVDTTAGVARPRRTRSDSRPACRRCAPVSASCRSAGRPIAMLLLGAGYRLSYTPGSTPVPLDEFEGSCERRRS